MDEKEQKKTDEREKCFVMMPISDQGDYPEGHFQKVYEQIFQPAIEQAGYQPYRVDENAISDRIIDKIFNAIQECPMALCDLSNRNPNVLYELGLRQAYDKPVVLVQDEKTDKIFDISGISTVFYKSDRVFENVIDAREKITRALIDTRDGKRNSIVKIVNAQTAKISAGDVTAEEKIEIMFSSIVNKLNELKEVAIISESNDSRNQYIELARDYRTRDMDNLHVVYRIDLKHGVTNAQIKDEIDSLQNIFGVRVEYKREGDVLNVACHNVKPNMISDMLRFWLASIGKSIKVEYNKKSII